MISVKRFVELEKLAQSALKRGDLTLINTLNNDADLQSAKMRFVVRGKKLYCAVITNQPDGPEHD